MGGPNRCRVDDDDDKEKKNDCCDDDECERCCCCRGPRGRRGPEGPPGGPQILVQDMLDFAQQGGDVTPRFQVGTILGVSAFIVHIQSLAREVQNVTAIGENSFAANNDRVFFSSRSAVYQLNVFLRVVFENPLTPTARTDLLVLTGDSPAVGFPLTQLVTSGQIPSGAVRTMDFGISGQVFFPLANDGLFLTINQIVQSEQNPVQRIDGSISLQFIRYVDGNGNGNGIAASGAPFSFPASAI